MNRPSQVHCPRQRLSKYEPTNPDVTKPAPEHPLPNPLHPTHASQPTPKTTHEFAEYNRIRLACPRLYDSANVRPHHPIHHYPRHPRRWQQPPHGLPKIPTQNPKQTHPPISPGNPHLARPHPPHHPPPPPTPPPPPPPLPPTHTPPP